MKVVPVILSTLCLFMTACGGGNSDPSSHPATGALSGNWQMTLQKTSTISRNQSGFLLEDQSAVTGGVVLEDTPCAGQGTVAGTTSGTDVSLLVDTTGQSINLMGTLGSDKASITGNYTILASGCGQPENGTWTADMVKPLNGSFQGSLVSTHTGGTFPISAQITQGKNMGTASAVLTGTMSSTGFPCFATANVSGLISGTAVVINFIDSDGNQIGQITATSTLDGTSLSGKYTIPPYGAPGSPCHAGDVGTVTITM